MDTELTLKLNEAVIEKAKKYASLHKTSLSTIIENYLQKIINENTEQDQLTPLVKSLSGIIDLSKDTDHKEAYSTFLLDKYK